MAQRRERARQIGILAGGVANNVVDAVIQATKAQLAQAFIELYERDPAAAARLDYPTPEAWGEACADYLVEKS
jgi:hypothetical protein